MCGVSLKKLRKIRKKSSKVCKKIEKFERFNRRLKEKIECHREQGSSNSKINILELRKLKNKFKICELFDKFMELDRQYFSMLDKLIIQHLEE